MELPLLVTRGLVAMPSVMLPLDVARPASIAAVRAAQQGQRRLVLALENGDGHHDVGVVAQLLRVTALAGGRLRVMVRTLSAVQLTETSSGFAEVRPIPTGPEASLDTRRALAERMSAWVRAHPALDDASAKLFADAAVPSTLLAGLAAQIGPFPVDQLQAWLAVPLAERIDGMVHALAAMVPESAAAPLPAPSPEDDLGPMPSELREGLRWTAEVHTRTGLLSEAEVTAVTADAWRGDWLAEHGSLQGLQEAAATVVRAITERHERRRSDWAERTDCDRLEEALDELAARGVVTGLMGIDLPDALAHVIASGGDEADYVVFHQGDLLDAVNGRGVDLAFGGPDPLATGELAADVLRRHGLAVHWTGRADTRLRVQMRWQRRLGGVRRAA